MTAPCYRCPERAQGCHASCPSYLEYSRQQERVRKQREENYRISDAFFERGDKIQRDAHRWAKKVRGK